jgi:hypothetical protein
VITLYSLSYTQEIYKVKVRESLPLFGGIIMPYVIPLVKNLFERGVFLAMVEDLHNQGQCQASFLLNQGIEVPLKLSAVATPSVVGAESEEAEEQEPWLRIEVDHDHKVTIHSPKKTREIIRGISESSGHFWSTLENHVVVLVEKFYKNNFFFVETDLDNAGALRTLFGYSDEIDLNVRVKAAIPQKA